MAASSTRSADACRTGDLHADRALPRGAILIALDMRSPSPVLRIGSMAVGVVSVAFVVAQHFLLLNPLFTDELTGKIPVFNLLLPRLSAAGDRRRRRWRSMRAASGRDGIRRMLACSPRCFAFAYATLSVRRLFQGEYIGLWAGMGQLETYAYSALWLAMGVALLVAGVCA